jgi:adenylate kinase
MEQSGVVVDYVVELTVEDGEIIRRLSARRVHASSGRTYHVEFNPPKVPDKDDVTGEGLIQREDDKEEAIRTRLSVYHARTTELAGYYSTWAASGDPNAPKYRKVNGTGSVEQVRERVLAALG